MLRPLASTDAEALLRLYIDPGVRAFLGGPLPPATARVRADVLLKDTAAGPAWAICFENGTGFLGMVTLDPHHDGRDMQLSYLLLPEHQGQGYATMAVTDALRRAFGTLGLTRVVAETQAGNVRSIRLLERVGMTFERRITRFGAEQLLYAARP